jgi:hypothetical protein
VSARRILNGTPGERWENTTGKVRFQLLVSWQNSCGRCIQWDRAISTSKWPTPFHRLCACKQIPIYPGKEGLPFVDFREEIDKLPEYRKQHIIGKAALRLVEKHVLRWPDVVTANRIKPISEIVARHKLTVEKMVAAGVDRRTAQRAFDRAHGHDAEALAETHRRAQEEAIAAKAEAQRQAKEAARRRLAEQEAKLKARPRQPGVTGTEAGSARVLADYLRQGNVKISAIEKVVGDRFGAINAEAEARRLRAEEENAAKAPKVKVKAPKVKETPEEAAARRKAERRDAEARLVADARARAVELVQSEGTGGALRALLTGKESAGVQDAVITHVLRAGQSSATVRDRVAGMTDEEEWHTITMDGVTYHTPPVPEFDLGQPAREDIHPLVKTARYLVGRPPLPESLTRHTRNVYFSAQRNSEDDHWAEEYGMPGFVSAATGGKGRVVFYNGVAQPESLVHEMGHNLATAQYGGIAVGPGAFRDAIESGEPPPTEYAGKSTAEDFAESVRMYVDTPDELRRVAPRRHAAIGELMAGRIEGKAAPGESMTPERPHPAPAAPAPAPTPGRARNFKGATAAEVKEYHAGMSREWADGLTRRERGAVEYYSSTAFGAMNALARTGSHTGTVRRQVIEEEVAHLEKALEKSSLEEAVVVYRGVSDHRALGLEPGATVTDRGFMSASLSPKVAAQFAGKGPDAALLEILAPAGSKGASVAGMSGREGEREVLFARHTTLRIVGRRVEKGRIVFTAEVEL